MFGYLLPASQETLMLFIAFLSTTHKPGVIKTYLQAVRNFHIEYGYANLFKMHQEFEGSFGGIKRAYGSGTNNCLPITPAILVKFSVSST